MVGQQDSSLYCITVAFHPAEELFSVRGSNLKTREATAEFGQRGPRTAPGQQYLGASSGQKHISEGSSRSGAVVTLRQRVPTGAPLVTKTGLRRIPFGVLCGAGG